MTDTARRVATAWDAVGQNHTHLWLSLWLRRCLELWDHLETSLLYLFECGEVRSLHAQVPENACSGTCSFSPSRPRTLGLRSCLTLARAAPPRASIFSSFLDLLGQFGTKAAWCRPLSTCWNQLFSRYVQVCPQAHTPFNSLSYLSFPTLWLGCTDRRPLSSLKGATHPSRISALA